MRYLERLKTKIENKSKDKSISTLNTDIDVPFWLSDDMVSKIDIKIDDSILFPCTKYGIFPYAVLKKISENIIIFDFFDERDVLRILQRKFVFCDTQDQNLFIKKIFENDLKRSYKSEIISDFYNEIKFILDMNEDFKKTMESIILSTFYKTNSDFFHIIEKNISDFMSSKNFKEWSEKCKKTISKYIDTSKLCSKQFGEVFTPEWLIKEMISFLPKANKNMIFLDPAAGIGNFSIFLVEKLMKDIEEEILDEEERKKHIIENMIVQCELQIKNAFINYYILDPENKYNLKIFRGSFLTDDFKKINPDFIKKCKEWGIESFDHVIANPPYNDSKSGGKKLWPLFFDKMFEIAKDKTLIICPDNWINRNSSPKFKNIIDISTSKQLIFANVNNKNIFPEIGESVGYFLFENKDKYKKTIFTNGEKEFEYDYIGNFVPFNDEDSLFLSIKNKTINTKSDNWHYRDFAISQNKLIKSGKFSEIKNEIHNYPIYHTEKQTFYAKSSDVYIGWKLILNNSGTFYSVKNERFQLVTKDIGVGLGAYGIKCGDEKQAINARSLFSSKLYRWLLNRIKTSGFNTEIKYFKLLDINEYWDDEKVYKYFNLTQEEIELIENTIKD